VSIGDHRLPDHRLVRQDGRARIEGLLRIG
jgi:hypothetical protein